MRRETRFADPMVPDRVTNRKLFSNNHVRRLTKSDLVYKNQNDGGGSDKPAMKNLYMEVRYVLAVNNRSCFNPSHTL